MLCFQTLSSMFVPKVIATIFVCLFIYLTSVTTFHFVNRETFSYLGYYNNMVCLDSKNHFIFYCFLIEDYKNRMQKKNDDFWKLRSLQKLKKN